MKNQKFSLKLNNQAIPGMLIRFNKHSVQIYNQENFTLDLNPFNNNKSSNKDQFSLINLLTLVSNKKKSHLFIKSQLKNKLLITQLVYLFNNSTSQQSHS